MHTYKISGALFRWCSYLELLISEAYSEPWKHIQDELTAIFKIVNSYIAYCFDSKFLPQTAKHCWDVDHNFNLDQKLFIEKAWRSKKIYILWRILTLLTKLTGARNFRISVNIGNKWKKRHECLILMLKLKVSKQTRNEASKNKAIIKKLI